MSGFVVDHVILFGPELSVGDNSQAKVALFREWDDGSRHLLQELDNTQDWQSNEQMEALIASEVSTDVVGRYTNVMMANMYGDDAPNQRYSLAAYQLVLHYGHDGEVLFPRDDRIRGLMGTFLMGVDLVAQSRRICYTGEGRLGLVPGSVQSGDMIAILDGCPPPMVLREHNDGVRLVGAAYVEGLNSYLPFDRRNLDATEVQQFHIY